MKSFITNNWKKILIFIGSISIIVNAIIKIATNKTLLADYVKYGKNIEKSEILENATEVITNKESRKYREVFIGKRKVIVKKSRITITKENVFAYMLLEFFRDINVDYFINNKYVNIEISKFIKDNNITLNDINKISNYFPSKCIKNINLTGVIYELIRQQTIKEINT